MTRFGPAQRRRWLWVSSAVVVLIAVGAGALWAARHKGGPAASSDCAVVEHLGQQWNAMVASIDAQGNGSGNTSDLTAIADARSAMSQKISDAAGHVSASSIQDSLRKWAEGSALGAKAQRESATDSTAGVARSDDDFSRGAVEVYQATALLRQACPKMPHDPAAH
jgi:hypothetical protein